MKFFRTWPEPCSARVRVGTACDGGGGCGVRSALRCDDGGRKGHHHQHDDRTHPQHPPIHPWRPPPLLLLPLTSPPLFGSWTNLSSSGWAHMAPSSAALRENKICGAGGGGGGGGRHKAGGWWGLQGGRYTWQGGGAAQQRVRWAFRVACCAGRRAGGAGASWLQSEPQRRPACRAMPSVNNGCACKACSWVQGWLAPACLHAHGILRQVLLPNHTTSAVVTAPPFGHTPPPQTRAHAPAPSPPPSPRRLPLVAWARHGTKGT